jgi:hypothetical protein
MMPNATPVSGVISGPFRGAEMCRFTKRKLCPKMGQYCWKMNLDVINADARRKRSELTVRPQSIACRFESITSKGLTDARG